MLVFCVSIPDECETTVPVVNAGLRFPKFISRVSMCGLPRCVA